MRCIKILPLLILISCSSPLTKKNATSSFIAETNLTKDQAFNGALSFLAKNLGKSNEAIQLKDPSSGRIISKIGVDCNELRAFADITSYSIMFTLDANFKDKKARFTLEGNTFSQVNIDGNAIVVGALLKDYQEDGVKKCAIKIKDELMEHLKSENSSHSF
jgi:Domain of unknown function (DUF4468) with TBP-like fold